jgi:hypothetical protein
MNWWPQHERILRGVQVVNIALGIATVAAIFLCTALVLPLWGAVTVGLLTACSPHLVSMTVYMLTETPAAFLVALLMALTAIGTLGGRRVGALFLAVLGIIVGSLSLFRPVFLALHVAVSAGQRYRTLYGADLAGDLSVGRVRLHSRPGLGANFFSPPRLNPGPLCAGGSRGPNSPAMLRITSGDQGALSPV